MTIDLTGSVAVVTGAASGIGRACAEALAAHGARVVIADIDASAAAQVADRLGAAGAQATASGLDVADWAACCRAAVDVGDDVDILVNAAATWTVRPFLEMDPEDWQRDLDVTLRGTLLATRAFLPAIVRRQGVVVNVSSDAGRAGEAGQVVYGAAKAGVIGMTRALAVEVGHHGVRVNCVAPGLTRTPGSAAFIGQIGEERLARKYPLGRIGEPTDVADAVLFLASAMSGWITGQVISVNGGYLTAG